VTSSFAKNDEARHLARLGLAALPLTRSQKLSVQLAIDLEQAWCKLEAAAGPDRLDSLSPRSSGGSACFGSTAASSAFPSPASIPPWPLSARSPTTSPSVGSSSPPTP
jgi:hypothetical protein